MEFDENKASTAMDLYSRQIGAFGVETMKNLIALDLLIVGMKGVGVETAKNLILAGPRKVAIADRSPIAIADLGANFFFHESDVGKPSASVCVAPLSVLNTYVNVVEVTEPITTDILAKHGAVVVTDGSVPRETLCEWDAFCRTHGILFLYGVTRGVTATAFADFGPKHVVTDETGEANAVSVVENIAVGKSGEGDTAELTITTSETHDFADDQLVTLTDVEGWDLSKLGSQPVKRVYMKYDQGKRQRLVPNCLTMHVPLALAASLPPYKCGGAVSEVKVPKTVEFLPLAESMVNPKAGLADPFLLHPNSEKKYKSVGEQLHLAHLALWRFQSQHGGQLPRLHSREDAVECVENAKKIIEEHKKLPEGSALVVDALDEDTVRRMALYARAELSGLSTFVGGVLAQEVVKKFGKFTPLRQWLHLDYFELLQQEVPADAVPVGGRYDHQVAVFGAEFQKRLERQKWFMVGCGALGCEYLKGFALMGLGAGEGGVVHVTDMDRIEVSNLNRQFLFRAENVGQQKSVCAANAAKLMNPRMNITCFETKVGPETENIFHDDFWAGLDGVCNALDNVIARRYVDSRCVLYEKPLLESGTLGTKANSEIIIPHKTLTYSEGKDTDQGKAIPMCTLRNFPHLIDHCIEWSRAQFTELFEDPPKDIVKLLDDRQGFLASLEKEGNVAVQLDKLQTIQKYLKYMMNPSFEQCVQLAVDEFHKQYVNRIRDLTYSFPENASKKDEVTQEEVPFWSGTKRFPHHALFDKADAAHRDYVFCTANLFAFMLNLPQLKRPQFDALFAKCPLHIDEWHPPKKAVSVEEPSKANAAPATDDSDDQLLASLKEEVMTVDASKVMRPQAAHFEKDDDANFHIDFVTACANMRAWNYHIKEASRHQCKMIAGRIIPAIATTTAMITGLVCLELYKLLLGLPKQHFCSANVNLALSDYNLFEPDNPLRAKAEYDPIEMDNVEPWPAGFTVWDKIVIDLGADVTLQQLIAALPKLTQGCELDMLVKSGLTAEDIKAGRDKPIWSSFAVTKTLGELYKRNMTRTLRDICVDLYGVPPQKKFVLLEASFRRDDKPVKTPVLKLVFCH
eukprot:TRINITY_DN890_c0_g1_i1.p1 TRINITY_DN890_c0_g1~~TRINITY_DN890_c0_g1_i1.p1  ORF type:complete len:1097 (-),score=334.49 TRINITY_DN890_c0_g1_i1:94-3342(-)